MDKTVKNVFSCIVVTLGPVVRLVQLAHFWLTFQYSHDVVCFK